MRRVFLLVVGAFFWACPGPTGSSDEVVPLVSARFDFLPATNYLFIAAEVLPAYRGATVDTVLALWFGSDTLRAPDTLGLVDDGLRGDIIANDFVYSRKISNVASAELSHPLANSDSGTVFISFLVRYSNTSYQKLIEFQWNRAPVIHSVAAPDTLIKPTSSDYVVSFDVTCEVSDENGLADINWVGFRTYHVELDSFMAQGNYIKLFDDGSNTILSPPDVTSGDAVAGDGIFTRRAIITSTANAGHYQWLFEAQDNSFAKSAVYTHNLVIQ